MEQEVMQAIRAELESNIDAKYREFHSSLVPGQNCRILGAVSYTHLSEFCSEDIEELKKKRIVFVAGGVGTCRLYTSRCV